MTQVGAFTRYEAVRERSLPYSSQTVVRKSINRALPAVFPTRVRLFIKYRLY